MAVELDIASILSNIPDLFIILGILTLIVALIIAILSLYGGKLFTELRLNLSKAYFEGKEHSIPIRINLFKKVDLQLDHLYTTIHNLLIVAKYLAYLGSFYVIIGIIIKVFG